MHGLDSAAPDLVLGLALPPEADPLGGLKEAGPRLTVDLVDDERRQGRPTCGLFFLAMR